MLRPAMEYRQRGRRLGLWYDMEAQNSVVCGLACGGEHQQ